jgi:hypothetical protein
MRSKKKKKKPLISIRIRKVANAYLVERDSDYATLSETLFYDAAELAEYVEANAPLIATRAESDACDD